MTTFKSELALQVQDAKTAIEARKKEGVLVGGSGFEPRLPIGNYEGLALGTIDLIDFIFKSGKDAGKPGTLIIAHVQCEAETVGVTIAEKDIDNCNAKAVVSFEIKNDKNGVKRATIAKSVKDASLPNEANEVDELMNELETLETGVKDGSIKGAAKAKANKRIAEINEKLELIA